MQQNGRIDLLAIKRFIGYLVIEQPIDSVIGQIHRYIAFIKEEIAKEHQK